MNKQYDVTIGIPVYQAEASLRATMESALAQTFERIEYLLLDDCGTDHSIDILKELQATHPRGGDIRIVSQPHNMGVSQARNRIIDEARGQFLYFMDSDDIIEPFTISLLMEHQRRTDADVVFGSYEKIELYNDNAVTEGMVYPKTDLPGEDQLAAFAYRKYGGIQALANNYLIRLQMLRDAGLHFINTNFWEDMAFTFEMVTYARRAVLLPDITYHYLCRLGSLSNYQERTSIGKDEILRNVATVDYMKRQSERLKGKPYLPNRYYIVLMTYFYIICNILKNKEKITPSFSNGEMAAWLRHPATLGEILRYREGRGKNLFFYLLGLLPSGVAIGIVKLLGRSRGLI